MSERYQFSTINAIDTTTGAELREDNLLPPDLGGGGAIVFSLPNCSTRLRVDRKYLYIETDAIDHERWEIGTIISCDIVIEQIDVFMIDNNIIGMTIGDLFDSVVGFIASWRRWYADLSKERFVNWRTAHNVGIINYKIYFADKFAFLSIRDLSFTVHSLDELPNNFVGVI